MPGSAEQLVELLELERLDTNLFRGKQPDTERQRVFGGQVAAQSLVAATKTVDAEFMVHSLHSYFSFPGDHTVPIIYDVERIRDGRSFVTRRVVARQHGRGIYYQTCSFQKAQDSFDHSDRMPDVIPPEMGLSLAELSESKGMGEEWQREWAALDVRYIGMSGRGLPPDPDHPALSRVWVRIDGELGDDPVIHQAAFTYASDMTLLNATLVPHQLTVSSPGVRAASLDHTIWFHRPLRADRWWLYDQASPIAHGGRGIAFGRVFDQGGELVASVAQEGMIRREDPAKGRLND